MSVLWKGVNGKVINSKKTYVLSVVLISIALVFSVIYAMKNYGAESSEVRKYYDNYCITYSGDEYREPEETVVRIIMENGNLNSDSNAVTVMGSDIYILKGGEYRLSGTWDKGSIIVQAADSRDVRLYLDNVNISSPNFAALCVYKASKVIISSLPGTVNALSDAAVYKEDHTLNDTVDAAVYSVSEVTLNGQGSLEVIGNYKDGVKTSKTLKVMSGDISVTAADDGFTGNKSVGIEGGSIRVCAGGDGIKSESNGKSSGFIALDSGVLNIDAQGDAIAATDYVFLSGNCQADIITGNGAETAEMKREIPPGTEADAGDDENDPSAKGIKGIKGIYADSGEYNINSKDDSIHSDGDIIFNGGSFIINSGDDGVHADKRLLINDGNITINGCYEGLEGKEYLEVNGGNINITASDDGMNAGLPMSMPAPGGAGGQPPGPPPGNGANGDGNGMPAEPPLGNGANGDGNGMPQGSPPGNGANGNGIPQGPPPGNGANGNGIPQGPPPGMSSEETVTYIRINGGNIVIYCGGDGIDSNCDLEINGGDITIIGPRPGADSALDIDGEMFINGGTVLTAGSSGMNETPSEESKQNSIWLNTDRMDAGAFIEIVSNGEIIHSFNAELEFNLILVSSDRFVKGNEYIFNVNGERLAAVMVEGALTYAGNSAAGDAGSPPPSGMEDNGNGNGNGMPPGPPPGARDNRDGNGAPPLPEMQQNADGASVLTTYFGNIKAVSYFGLMLAALIFILVYKRRY